MSTSSTQTMERETVSAKETAQRAPSSSSSKKLAKYGLLIVLVAEIAIFSLLSPSQFGTLANLHTTLLSESVLAILALAVLVPLIAGEFDMSLAMVFTTVMLVVATLIAHFSWPIWVAFVFGAGLATFMGTITGLLVIATGANSLIVSLGVSILLRGVSEALTQGSTIIVGGADGQVLREISRSMAYGTVPIISLAVIAFGVWFVTEMTPLGRKWYAVGGSNEGARLVGLKTNALRVSAFAVGGFLAGLASLLQLSASTTATASFGANFLFPAFAAAFLGAIGFRIGAFNVRGTLAAIFALAFGVVGIKILGAPKWIDGIFYGAALIIAVAVVQAVWERKS